MGVSVKYVVSGEKFMFGWCFLVLVGWGLEGVV